MRVFVVLNPVAGRSGPESIKQSLRRRFGEVSWELTIYETTGGEKIAEEVKQAIEDNYDLIIAAGGDGTVSAVVDGVVGSDIPMGIIPAGTSNITAQDLGISLNVEKACRSLTGETGIRNLDVLEYEGRYYIHSLGTGLGALALRRTNREQKRRFGPFAYVWAVIRAVLGLQPETFTIVADGKTHRYRAADVMLTNVGTLTKPFRWGPHIKPDDGVIDICIMKAKSIIDIFGVAWDIVAPGGIRRQRNLVYLSATDTVEISAERVLPVQGDGELLGKTPIEAKLIAGAVKVMVPREKSRKLRLKLPVSNLLY